MIPVCPKCDSSLFILNFKGIEVDFCQQCRGLWLDAGEIQSLMTLTGANSNDPLLKFQHQNGLPAQGRKYLCPRCDQPMEELPVREHSDATLHLERCEHGHGLWFDAGELERLLTAFPPETGTAKTIDFLNEIFGAAPKP